MVEHWQTRISEVGQFAVDKTGKSSYTGLPGTVGIIQHIGKSWYTERQPEQTEVQNAIPKTKQNRA